MTSGDPLSKFKEDQALQKRGRLKVFLGMAAGVGKTYSMLSEARELAGRHEDVLVGYVEPHGREETESLLEGLNILPPKVLVHRGIELRDFDLDEAIRRKPKYLLVDELAHSNPEGFRHSKRWQDVEECLQAGINVLTTVNIQHIESLRDVVAQITHVFVNETIPDAFIESADEIELVDLPPEQLHQRLRDGKVYRPDKVDQALSGFFKRTNLLALRELALRHTAEQVDRAILDEKARAPDREPWHVTDRIVVCLAPNRMAPRVVRAAKRLATSLHAELIAVTVESSRQARSNDAMRQQLDYALRLAEELGARTVSLSNQDIVSELVRFARAENATTIVMGKPVRPRWRELLFGSVVDATVRASGDIDVLVITGAEEAGTQLIRRPKPVPISWTGVLEALAFPGICALFGLLIYSPIQLTNITMLFVVASVLVSMRRGLRESAIAAVFSVLLLNFCFIEPRFTFAVADFRYSISFGVMLAVSLLLSALNLRLRENSEALAERERRTASLYDVTKQLSESRKQLEMANAVVSHLQAALGRPVAVYSVKEGAMGVLSESSLGFESEDHEQAVADWVLHHGEAAGAGTETLSGARGLYVPLKGSEFTVGVLAIDCQSASLTMSQRHYVDAVANQLANSLERAQFAKQAQEKALRAEAETMRSNLLSAVSHDLRTPLASIEGSATALLNRDQLSEEDRVLAKIVIEESQRMARLIRNLLDMTRVQGIISLQRDWESIEDLIHNAIDRTANLFTATVEVNEPPACPPVHVDGVLVEQVMVNLLENCSRYAGKDCKVTISFGTTDQKLWVSVLDDGPGIEAEMLETAFEPFNRKGTSGFGLGLAICKAAIEAHDGSIWAVPVEKGAEIRWEVPLNP